jgi:excisionase family DNA binding protein
MDETYEDLLTVGQAAERLQVTALTIRRYVHEQRLPAYRLGGGTGPIRIRERDLEAFLQPTGSSV